MSADNSTNITRVAIYARRSTNQQKDSIERQLASVLPYCEQKRYTVVGEPYTDLGIAGDVFDKRPEFQHMLRDAAAGLFDVIVCDEWSRLSRQDPLDFSAMVARPLRDASVTLDTVAEGTERWDDLAQLILMTVKADKSQDESKIRSYRVLTGMVEHARRGAVLSKAPQGYLTEYETVQEPGKPPRVRPVRFIPDPRRAHVVPWIFKTYAEGGWAMDEIARELNARAVEPPAGKGGQATKSRGRGEPCTHWTSNSVRALLKNVRFTGAMAWNRRSRGKYHKLTNGQAVSKGSADDRPNDRQEWIVSAEPDHELLVSQELFERAQARMRVNKGGKPKHGAYLFSGLVVCSHCGRRLVGISKKGKKQYRCHLYDQSGVQMCGYNAVDEEWLLDRVLRVLEEEMLAPRRLQALREEIRRQEEAERAPVAVEPMEKRLRELEANIAQGRSNLVILPEDQVPHVVAVIRSMEEEQAQVKAELARRQGRGNLDGLEDAIAECEALLWRLRDASKESDPLLLREVLSESVVPIELAWNRERHGKRMWNTLRGGVIHLRPQVGAKSHTLHGKPCSSRTSDPAPASI